MTREEREKAIDLLDNLLGMVEDNQDNDYDKALKMGIESLRREPSEDWHDIYSDEMTLEQSRKAVRDLREKLSECLRKEPCEDAVSRQSVKDGMIKYGFLSPDMTVTEFVEDMLPPVTPTQRWIPCSERLPKKCGFYLVSTTDCITIMEFCKEWISQNIGSCNWYVKAWQPLPKPYKEKE